MEGLTGKIKRAGAWAYDHLGFLASFVTAWAAFSLRGLLDADIQGHALSGSLILLTALLFVFNILVKAHGETVERLYDAMREYQQDLRGQKENLRAARREISGGGS